jgi:uncharacterized protein YjgD (DUF1641 family)
MTMASHVETSGIVPQLLAAVDQAGKDVAAGPRPQGGLTGLWTLMKQQSMQEGLQYAMAILNALRRTRVKSG